MVFDQDVAGAGVDFELAPAVARDDWARRGVERLVAGDAAGVDLADRILDHDGEACGDLKPKVGVERRRAPRGARRDPHLPPLVAQRRAPVAEQAEQPLRLGVTARALRIVVARVLIGGVDGAHGQAAAAVVELHGERFAQLAGALARRALGEDRAADADGGALDAHDLDAAGEVLELDGAQRGALEAVVDGPLVLGGEGGGRGRQGEGDRRDGQPARCRSNEFVGSAHGFSRE
jgi:hypothetical protein